MHSGCPFCLWSHLGGQTERPNCRKGLEANTHIPKQHHPELAQIQMELGVGRTVQSLLGAGGHGQDRPPRPALLLWASENLSLSSKLLRPEPAGRVAWGPLPSPTLKSTDLTWSDHGGNIWTSHRAHGKTARQGVCSRV